MPPIKLGPSKWLPLCDGAGVVGNDAVVVWGFAVVLVLAVVGVTVVVVVVVGGGIVVDVFEVGGVAVVTLGLEVVDVLVPLGDDDDDKVETVSTKVIYNNKKYEQTWFKRSFRSYWWLWKLKIKAINTFLLSFRLLLHISS